MKYNYLLKASDELILVPFLSKSGRKQVKERQDKERNEKYQVLVLVPTIALVDQWKDEVESFGFTGIIEVSVKKARKKGNLS